MGRKGRQRPRSNKAIARDRFPLGVLAQRRKQLRDEFIQKSKVCKKYNKKLSRLKEKVEKVTEGIENLKSLFADTSCLLSNRKIMGRKKNPTKVKSINSEEYEKPDALRSFQRRTKETIDACASVHGGRVDEKLPTLDGMWISLVNVANPKTLSNYIGNSKKVMEKVLPKVVKAHVKSYEQSPENMLRSVEVLYSKKLLTKVQYKDIRTNLTMPSSSKKKKQEGLQFSPDAWSPKLLSYDKLIEYVKSIDIGNVKDIKQEFCADLEEDMKVDGSYRELESFLIELANLYIQVDQLLGEKSTFMHFGSDPYHFRVAIGADGAPFGKDDEATAWLVSFLNVGVQIASESECFLIAGANCSETHISMIRYGQRLMSEIAKMESKIYHSGTDESFTVKFTFELVPSDMKWASFFSGELPNSAFYFSPFGNVNDNDKDTVNGSLGTDEGCTWKPWDYSNRNAIIF